jgi:DNA-binding FrmR family transcriptional regulator
MIGYVDNKPALRSRLRRIEGQVRGIERLIDEDTYCIDILTQISAASRALEGVALTLLEGHLGHCVKDAIESGGDEADSKMGEAMRAIRRLVRS